MLPICRYFFSILLALTTCCAFSQETDVPPPKEEEPTVREKEKDPADTLKNKYLPTGIRLGTDVVSFIKSRSTDYFNGWEVNADVDFYRYYLTVDYGSWSRTEVLDNGDYKNNGTYFRVGVDVNFLLKDPDRNMFFIGFRYGHSAFNENLNVTHDTPGF